MKAESIFKYPNTLLGEGPVWDQQRQSLWWVDIEQGTLNELKPNIKSNRVFKLGQMVGAAALKAQGGLILALQNGFASFDPDHNLLEMLEPVESDLPANRFNDGKCDPAGRFWAGTMEIDPINPAGNLYFFCPNRMKSEKKLDNIYISNGLAWTKDHSLMYYIDSLTYKVKGYRYVKETGEIKFQRDVLTLDKSLGIPDGMTIDENNNLWIAFYDGAKVCCFNPLTGVLLDQIDVAAQRPTSCTFGGTNLDTLYITTAAKENDPFGGAIFAAKPGVRGLLPHLFGA